MARQVFSHSRLSTFEQCPLKFKYQYVDRVKIEDRKEGIEAFMGSRVHESLESLYNGVKRGRVSKLDWILQAYDKRWQKDLHENILVNRNDLSVDNYLQFGRKCITDYYTRFYPFDQDRTVGVEEKISFPIGENGAFIEGYVDRISMLNSGHYRIHDYKTSQKLPTQEEKDKDRQLAFYQIGLAKRVRDVQDVDLIWHFLFFDKDIKSKRTGEQLIQLQSDTVKLIESIWQAVAKNDFPAKESRLCLWCEFQQICPKRRHLFKGYQPRITEF